MANIENIPLQDNYDTTLTNRLEKVATALTIEVKDTPSYTPTNTPTKAVINPGKSNAELVIITDYDASNRTITIEAGGRAQPLYKGDTGTIQEHVSGSQLIISDNYAFWNEIAEATNSKANSLGLPCEAYADAAARDAALPTPTNGMQCYIISDGKFNDYTAGSWVARESGGTFANASETVAGKVEIATEAQALAGDDTDETGAKIVMTPANGAITDVAQTAAGYIPKTNATGVVSKELVEALKGTGSDVNSANLDILTNGSNADTLHSHIALGTAGFIAGEDIAGTSTTAKACYIYTTPETAKVLDEVNNYGSTGFSPRVQGTRWYVQPFYLRGGATVTQIEIYARVSSLTVGTMYVDIYELDGSFDPTGAYIERVEVDASTLTVASSLITMTFSEVLDKSKTYGVVFSYPIGTPTIYIELSSAQSSTSYSPTHVLSDSRISNDSGVTWSLNYPASQYVLIRTGITVASGGTQGEVFLSRGGEKNYGTGNGTGSNTFNEKFDLLVNDNVLKGATFSESVVGVFNYESTGYGTRYISPTTFGAVTSASTINVEVGQGIGDRIIVK